MPLLNSEEGRQWPALLAERAGSDADSARVADTVIGLWHEIDEALHPIIGRRGVAALYSRSLTLTAATHPWLAQGHPGTQASAIDTTALKAALAAQPAAQGLAGSTALFQSFHALLASLVGASLTDRLLRSVWVHSSGTTSGTSPTQDTSS